VAFNCSDFPHHPEEAGRTGIVHGEQARSEAPSHPFIVVFDPPVPRVSVGVSLVPLPARHYAADELELIED